MEGRKILIQARKQKIDPTMRMFEVIQLTGMNQRDLEFFTSSCRSIDVVQSVHDKGNSIRYVHGLVRIFFRMVNDGVIR